MRVATWVNSSSSGYVLQQSDEDRNVQSYGRKPLPCPWRPDLDADIQRREPGPASGLSCFSVTSRVGCSNRTTACYLSDDCDEQTDGIQKGAVPFILY